MSEIQAICFDRSIFTKKQSDEWLDHHRFYPISNRLTKHLRRYRIIEPYYFNHFITKKINDITFIIGFK
jgi:hypothetical protein